jgi:hypothetical protein
MNSKVLKSSTFYSNLPISTFQDTSLLLHLQSLSLSLYIYIYNDLNYITMHVKYITTIKSTIVIMLFVANCIYRRGLDGVLRWCVNKTEFFGIIVACHDNNCESSTLLVATRYKFPLSRVLLTPPCSQMLAPMPMYAMFVNVIRGTTSTWCSLSSHSYCFFHLRSENSTT